MVIRMGTGHWIQNILMQASPSPHRVILEDPWSVEASCRALCPGVMSPVTLPPSLVSIPKSAATWSG